MVSMIGDVHQYLEVMRQSVRQLHILVIEQDVGLPDGAVRYPEHFHSTVFSRVPA